VTDNSFDHSGANTDEEFKLPGLALVSTGHLLRASGLHSLAAIARITEKSLEFGVRGLHLAFRGDGDNDYYGVDLYGEMNWPWAVGVRLSLLGEFRQVKLWHGGSGSVLIRLARPFIASQPKRLCDGNEPPSVRRVHE